MIEKLDPLAAERDPRVRHSPIRALIDRWRNRAARLKWGSVHDDDLIDEDKDRWSAMADATNDCAAELEAALSVSKASHHALLVALRQTTAGLRGILAGLRDPKGEACDLIRSAIAQADAALQLAEEGR